MELTKNKLDNNTINSELNNQDLHVDEQQQNSILNQTPSLIAGAGIVLSGTNPNNLINDLINEPKKEVVKIPVSTIQQSESSNVNSQNQKKQGEIINMNSKEPISNFNGGHRLMASLSPPSKIQNLVFEGRRFHQQFQQAA